MVKAVLRRAAASRRPRTTSPWASTTTSPTPAWTYDPSFHQRARRASTGPCSTAWAPTAPSGPTRTPSRSSARTPTTTCRATSSTTPRRPASSPSATCASVREPIRSAYLVDKADFVACHVWAFLERYKTLLHARPGRHLSAQLPLPGRRGVGPAALREPGPHHRAGAQGLRHQRLRGGQEDRHGRPHQHHHADLLLLPLGHHPAGRGHRRHQGGHQEDLRQARRQGRPDELQRRGPGHRQPARDHRTRRGHRHHGTSPRWCPRRRPSSSRR